MPAVYYAVQKGYVKMVKVLCKHGADVDTKAELVAWDDTPLTIAVQHANLQMVRALCERGANVNAICDPPPQNEAEVGLY